MNTLNDLRGRGKIEVRVATIYMIDLFIIFFLIFFIFKLYITAFQYITPGILFGFILHQKLFSVYEQFPSL